MMNETTKAEIERIVEKAVGSKAPRGIFLAEHIFAFLLGTETPATKASHYTMAVIDIIAYLTSYSRVTIGDLPEKRLDLLAQTCQMTIWYQMEKDGRRRPSGDIGKEVERLKGIEDEAIFVEECNKLAHKFGYVGGVIALTK